MPDYSIISPLAYTADNVTPSFRQGLGNTPINPFAAGVAGVEQGLAFGADLAAKIQETNRLNDPDVLAADKLKADLANQQMTQVIRSNTRVNNLGDKYAEQQILTELEEKRAHADYYRKSGDAEGSLKEQERQARIDKLEVDTAENRAKGEEARRQNAPATFDPATRTWKMPPTSNGYDGSFPQATPRMSAPSAAPAPDGSDINTSIQALSSHKQLKSKASNAQTYKQVEQSLGMPISMTQEKDGTYSALVTPNETDFSADGTLDPAVALATLSQSNAQYKTADSPDKAVAHAGINQTLFESVGVDNIDKYIATQPPEQQEYLNRQKNYATASIAANGNPQYLNPEQQILQAAKFPLDKVADPEKTFKDTLDVLTDGTTVTTDPVIKNALDNDNFYLPALTTASKNGTQAVTIRKVQNDQAPEMGADISQAPPPPARYEFMGADGTKAYAPAPITNPDAPDPAQQANQARLNFATAVAAKLKDRTDIAQSTAKATQDAQGAVQQGGFQAAAQPAPAPTAIPASSEVIPKDQPFEHPKRPGTVLSPNRAAMESYWKNQYMAEQGEVPAKEVPDVKKAAADYAKNQVKEYQENVLAPAKKALDKSEDAEKGFTSNNARLESLLKEAKAKGFEDVFGPGWAETKRTGRDLISRLPFTPDELQERNAFRAKFELWQSKQIREEAAASASTMRTNAEQRTALLANPNLGHTFENLEFITQAQKNAISGNKDAIKFERLLQSRGYLMDSADQDAFVSDYVDSKANLKQITSVDENGKDVLIDNPDYRTPEDFLYGRDPTPDQKKSEVQGAAAVVVAPEPSGPSGGPSGGSGNPAAPGAPDGQHGATGTWQENPQPGPLSHILPFASSVAHAVANPSDTIIGSPEDRAAQAKQIAEKRLASFPEDARAQIDSYKEELNKSLDSSAFSRASMGLDMILSNIAPDSQDYLRQKLEGGYDAVVNKAQSILGERFGYTPEVIDKNQQTRDSQRTAIDETIEDQKTAHPWVNAAAATVGYGVLFSAIGKLVGAGATGLNQLLKAGGPTATKAAEYIGELATTPKAQFLNRLNTAGVTQVVQSGDVSPGEYGTGAALGAGAEVLAGGVNTLGRGLNRAVGSPFKKSVPESLAHGLKRGEVAPDTVAVDRLADLSPQAQQTIRGMNSSPAAVGAVDRAALAANTEADLVGAQKAAGVQSDVLEGQQVASMKGATQGVAADIYTSAQNSVDDLLNHTGMKPDQLTKPQVSGGTSGGLGATKGQINPKDIQDHIGNLKANAEEVLQARNTAYEKMRQDYGHKNTETLDPGITNRLQGSLEKQSEGFSKQMIERAHERLGLEKSRDVQPNFEFLDELRNTIRDEIDDKVSKGVTGGLSDLKAMRKAVEKSLNAQLPQGQSYSDFLKKSGNTIEAGKNITKSSDLLKSIHEDITRIDPQKNLETKYFEGGTKAADLEKTLGKDQAADLRSRLRSIDTYQILSNKTPTGRIPAGGTVADALGISEKEWAKRAADLPAGQPAAIENFYKEAAKIDATREMFPETSAGKSPEGSKIGRTAITHYGWRMRALHLLAKVFESPPYAGLTKTEQRNLSKALSQATGPQIKQILTETADAMRGTGKDFHLGPIFRALGAGYGEGVKYENKAFEKRKGS